MPPGKPVAGSAENMRFVFDPSGAGAAIAATVFDKNAALHQISDGSTSGVLGDAGHRPLGRGSVRLRRSDPQSGRLAAHSRRVSVSH